MAAFPLALTALNALDELALRKVLASAGEALCQDRPADAAGTPSVELQQAHSAASALLLEAARSDTSSTELAPVLEEHGASAAVAAAMLEELAARKAPLRASLATMRPGLAASIVDVKWRLDYQIRSTARGAENSLAYIVRLVVADAHAPAGGTRDIEFVASLEQLQALLDEVREATKAVERLVG